MNDIKKIQNIIDELNNRLSVVLFSQNLEFSVVRLLFLKYVVDNYVGVNSVDNMQLCARAQKMFAMRDIENGMEIIVPVLNYIDDAYGLTNVLSSYDNIGEYDRELFGSDRFKQKKNIVTDDFKTVMDFLGTLDLEEKDEEKALGKLLVTGLIDNIIKWSNRSSYSREYSTRINLCKLADKILDVKSDEVFCDFVSGVGLSTIEITKNRLPKIVNNDINSTAVAISTMLYIMYGYKNFMIYNEDSLTKYNNKICGDKIFVDGPIAMKLEKTEENEYTDSSLAVINRVLQGYMSESDDALAVITVPSSVLFANRMQNLKVRQELVTKGLLKAVIALPPMWRTSGIGTNLLVISRKKQDEVVFINAADENVSPKDRLDRKGDALLQEDKIELIVKAISEKETTIDFSSVVSKEKIEEKEFDLLPASYVEVSKEDDDTTLADIEEQLTKLYEKLIG